MTSTRSIDRDDLPLKTYRYLRIAMSGAVLTLTVSIVIERLNVSCWQTSVSGYYYTPVRAIFVGALMAIGANLIVIKGGTTWEDIFFNFAGVMAPAVAVLPTTNVGRCWSVDPPSSPVDTNGNLAAWVVGNIENNTRSLLIAGFIGLAVAALIAMISDRAILGPARVGTAPLRWGLLATGFLLVAILALHLYWNNFATKAHGFSALIMFVFLGAGILSNALQRRNRDDRRTYMIAYFSIVGAMALAGLLLLPVFDEWDHRTLVLEAIEVALFLVFWLFQTNELWNETSLSQPLSPVTEGSEAH